MVTFVIDENAYELLNQWVDSFSDLPVRFGHDITPKFNKAKILFQLGDGELLDIRYNVDLNKVAFMYIPFVDKPSIRFRIVSADSPFRLCDVISEFERVATFYVNIAYLFCNLNAFILYENYSAAAKKAMMKKTLLDFKRDTFFTIRKKDRLAYLDTCKLTINDKKLIVD